MAALPFSFNVPAFTGTFRREMSHSWIRPRRWLVASTSPSLLNARLSTGSRCPAETSTGVSVR